MSPEFLKLKEQLVDALLKALPRCQEIYRFCSWGTAAQRPDSDIDLAILPSQSLRWELHRRLLRPLSVCSNVNSNLIAMIARKDLIVSAEHDKTIERIKARLMQLHPHKIILFGSHAWGIPGTESDIDLVVILDKDEIPGSYAERMENILNVRKCVADINREVSLDILVYSKQEWQRFIEVDSFFSREIREKGRELL
jgi:predicted nucleotidyltransferase